MLRNTIYYNLKPFIPRALRTVARRQLIKGMRHKVGDVWPIMPGSEVKPHGWPGWPQEKSFALVLTHDVEGQAGLKKCQALMQIEMEMGFRSSFNFIPEGSYRAPATLRQELLQNGFEVGVHDLRHDGRLFRSEAGFTARAAKINRYLQEWDAVGFRSGFMLHKLDWLHHLKIDYDMSTFDTDPFEPQPEGRHTIFPSWISRLPAVASRSNGSDSVAAAANGSSAGYIELPYTLPQDSTLFLLLQESSPEIWLRKLDWIAANGGMALINTHPDYMSFNGSAAGSFEYPVRFYKEFLSYIRDKYAGSYWPALPREVAQHMMRGQTSSSHSTDADKKCAPASNGKTAAALSTALGAETGIREPNGIAKTSVPRHRDGWDSSTPDRNLSGKCGAVLLFSHYPADPRPRRAAEALAAEGVKIDLICLQENSDDPKRETINGVKIIRVPLKRRRRGALSYAWQYAAFISVSFAQLSFRSLVRRYDFVHVHNMPDVLVFSALVPKLLGARIVLDLHDPMPELMEAIFNLPPDSYKVRALEKMEKWSIAFSDVVLTVSRTFEEVFSSRSCSSDKIRVIVNSPDEQIFRFREPQMRCNPEAEPERPFVVLYHGSLLKRNGLDLVVDALEIVRKKIPQAKLLICGKPTAFFREVMESVEKRGLSSAVKYLGAKQLEGIVEAIERCDVGVIPNHRNIFTELNTPTRIFECLALGKPIVAPRARGIRDYFGEMDLIYFELGNARDLAERIEHVYFHPDEVEQTVRRGQQIYQRHTWTSERTTLLNAFSTLLDS